MHRMTKSINPSADNINSDNGWLTPDWPVPANIKALVTSRQGGTSQPPFDNMNLGDHVGDSVHSVEANRQALLDSMPGCEQIRWLQQIHGTDCVDSVHIADNHQADASFSTTPGLACAIMTADCLPVIFCDKNGTRVAAAHAGWKGLANGVLLNTLAQFEDPQQVLIWLGPAIAKANFEVGPEVRTAFNWATDDCFTAGQGDRLYADLYELARQQLLKAGVARGQIYGGGLCTFADAERFYSYRRETTTGRLATCIWIEKT